MHRVSAAAIARSLSVQMSTEITPAALVITLAGGSIYGRGEVADALIRENGPGEIREPSGRTVVTIPR